MLVDATQLLLSIIQGQEQEKFELLRKVEVLHVAPSYLKKRICDENTQFPQRFVQTTIGNKHNLEPSTFWNSRNGYFYFLKKQIW